MQRNKLDANKNIAALVIGFFLIVAIAAVTLFRSPLLQKNNNAVSPSEQNQALSNLKKSNQISDSDLANRITGHDNIIMIDIRPENDYKTEHILNSKNIPLPNFASAISGLDKNKIYIIIDGGSALSSVAMVITALDQDGFAQKYYLDGGLAKWKLDYNPTISDGDPTSFTDQSKIKYIQTDKLKEMMASETNLVIIDVRKSDQFNVGHLKGAMNIFLDDLEARKNEIPLGKKIILYDDDGLSAFKAGVKLFDLGFFNALSLSDGLDNWKAKNYEIVK